MITLMKESIYLYDLEFMGWVHYYHMGNGVQADMVL